MAVFVWCFKSGGGVLEAGGNDDFRGADQAAFDFIAFLRNRNHCFRLHAVFGLGGQRFVFAGVEFLAHRVDGFDAVFVEHGRQLVDRLFDTFGQFGKLRIALAVFCRNLSRDV